MHYGPTVNIHRIWLHWPGGYTRLSTVAMAATIFVAVTLLRRRPWLGVVTTVAWLALYEMGWQAGTLMFGGPSQLGYTAWFFAAIVAWPLLAHAMGVRANLPLAGFCLLTFMVWFAMGYRQTYPGTPIHLPEEVLNEAGKTALGIAYLVGALRLEPGVRWPPLPLQILDAWRPTRTARGA